MRKGRVTEEQMVDHPGGGSRTGIDRSEAARDQRADDLHLAQTLWRL